MVSIIIPVYNDLKHLKFTLEAIREQSVNIETEIIVVDNGSTDETKSWLDSQPDVKFLVETNHPRSPYSCRNRGIEIANGDVLVLLDATCKPDKDWLQNGLEFIQDSGANIVGGNVLFDFEGKMTAGKIYDSLTNIKMRESIEKGVAKTANLFIRRSVFDKIGMFPEGIRSGADVRWTYKATTSGITLSFCSNAVVYKVARGLKDLLKKQWRVGLHQPLIWKDLGNPFSFYTALKKIVVPVSPHSIRKLLQEKGTKEMKTYFLRVWLIAQMVKITMGLSNFIGIFKLKYSR